MLRKLFVVSALCLLLLSAGGARADDGDGDRGEKGKGKGKEESVTQGIPSLVLNGEEAQVSLGANDKVYSFGATSEGFFLTLTGKDAEGNSKTKTILRTDDEGNVEMEGSLTAHFLATRRLNVAGMEQWSVRLMDVVSAGSGNPINRGWSSNVALTCEQSGMVVLTGIKTGGKQHSLQRLFSLPSSSSKMELAKFEMQLNYIDAWSGESAYVLLSKANGDNPQYLYVNAHTEPHVPNSLSACGDKGVGDSKLVETATAVVMVETGEEYLLSIGSFLNPEDNAHFGISALTIYTMSPLQDDLNADD